MNPRRSPVRSSPIACALALVVSIDKSSPTNGTKADYTVDLKACNPAGA
ncbi:MAG: hypothetical protein ABI379_07555 [Rhodanobacter sp.]